MAKMPWMKFFPTDWLGDAALRRCSLSAKGLWIELLSLMHQCDPRGVLPWTRGDVFDVIGTKKETEKALKELINRGVVSQNEDGFLYSRRMAKESGISDTRSESGKKGADARWGKDVCHGKGDGKTVAKPMANTMANSGIWHMASGSDSSPSGKGNAKGKPKAKVTEWEQAQEAMTSDVLKTGDFETSWTSWADECRTKRKALTKRQIGLQIHDLEEMGHDRAIQSIRQSIKNGYTGLFEPKLDGRSTGPNSGQPQTPAAKRRADKAAGEFAEPDLNPTIY